MIIAVLFFQFRNETTKTEPLLFNELAAKIKAGEIARIIVDENDLEVIYHDGTVGVTRKEPTKTTVEQLKDLGVHYSLWV
jgi:hypothetical protein